MSFTLTDIIGAVDADGPLPRKIRRALESPGAEAVVTFEALAWLVIEAQRIVANEITSLGKPVMLSSFDLSTVAGQKAYALPAACRKIARVDMLQFGAEIEMDYIEFEDAFDAASWASGLCAPGWTLKNDDLLILPTPAASVATFARVHYRREAPDLLRAKVRNVGAGNLAITLEPSDATNAGPQETLADWYAGARVKVTGAPGLGNTATVTASAYHSGTGGLRLTLDAALADVTTSSVVELMSALPRAAKQAVLTRAALQWAQDNQAVEDQGRLGAEYAEARGQFLRDLSRNQHAQPRRIRETRGL